MAPNETYLAVLADVVGSRAVDDRAALQERMAHALARWSAGTAPCPAAAGPEITAGDEVQLLLRPAGAPGNTAEQAIRFLAGLAEVLHPERLVAGIGAGPLATALRPRVGENDGPCFHRAREALALAKRDGRFAVVRGVEPAAGDAINALWRLAGDLRAGWTDRQREVIARLRHATYRKDVAHELGVSPSVVTEVLGAARFDAVAEAEKAAAALLGRELARPPGETP